MIPLIIQIIKLFFQKISNNFRFLILIVQKQKERVVIPKKLN